jgi:hypothetical protein
MKAARLFFSCYLIGHFFACSAEDDGIGPRASGGTSNTGGTSGSRGGASGAAGKGGAAGASGNAGGAGGPGSAGSGGNGGRAGSGGAGGEDGGPADASTAGRAGSGGSAGSAGASGSTGSGGTGAAGTGGIDAGTTDGGAGAGGQAGTGGAGAGGSAGVGGGSGDGGVIDAGVGDSGTSGNPACGVTIDQIAAYTHNKVLLASGGVAVPASNTAKRGLGYVIAGRDALFRVSVTATNTVTDITATLTLTSAGVAQKFSAVRKAPAKSTDNVLDSTFNIKVPATAIATDSAYSVALTQAAPCPTPGESRFPKSGEQALEARASGKLHVAVLITQINSLPVAVFDDDRKALFLQDLKRDYPQLDAEVRVIPGVYKWTFPAVTVGDQGDVYDACGSYFDDTSKFPRGREFLVCVYRQQSAFPRGVSGGIAYLTEEQDLRATDVGNAATAIVGYPTSAIPTDGNYPDWMRLTFIHELGHTLGAPHAPSGGASDPDPSYPTDAAHNGGKIGIWGWDPENAILREPTSPDLMGYDWIYKPLNVAAWVSDYNYGKFTRRIQRVDTIKLITASATAQRYRSALLVRGSPARLTGTAFTSEYTPRGKPTTLTARRKGSLQTETVTGYLQPSSEPSIARIVFPDDGTLDALLLDGTELTLK